LFDQTGEQRWYIYEDEDGNEKHFTGPQHVIGRSNGAYMI